MTVELIDVQIRVPAEMEKKIEALGEQCGLTKDQMASAMFVLATRNMQDETEVAQPVNTTNT